MKVLLAIVLFTAVFCHLHHHDHDSFITASYLKDLKAKASFEVYSQHNHPFKGYSLSQLKGMLGLKRHPEFVSKKMTYGASSTALPTTFDARTQWPDCVHDIRDQAQCGSCWAFSTTGSVEGAVQIATGRLTSVSEQQLVDCAGSAGNQGCNGGLMDDAFNWIISHKGLGTEASYPYTARDGTCKDVPSVSTISGFKDVQQGSESALMTALQSQPVSIAIEADQSSFQFYKSGVFKGPCGQQLDHGVLLVGAGTDSGVNYWRIKNSWGSTWGDNGYIRVVQGQNMCGLANMASYPTA